MEDKDKKIDWSRAKVSYNTKNGRICKPMNRTEVHFSPEESAENKKRLRRILESLLLGDKGD